MLRSYFKIFLLAVTTFTIIFFSSTIEAEVTMPKIFGSNMVLQRNMPVAVWGWADKGERITVRFNGQEMTAMPDNNGRWFVKLVSMKASKSPMEMTVTGKNTLKFNNILIGEIWICSGQSNMAMTVSSCLDFSKEKSDSNYPEIRQATVSKAHSGKPVKDIFVRWTVCSSKTVGGFSAIGYFFGKSLFQELDVPIGLISTNWPGTPIEPWIAPEGYRMVPELKELSTQVDEWDSTSKAGSKKHKEFIQNMKEWIQKSEKALDEGREVPDIPAAPIAPDNHQAPTKLYNAMIAPLIPYTIRGTIWYQGESNGSEGLTYFYKKQALIKEWRKLWNQGDFPFYFVQLANYKNSSENNPEMSDGWAHIRDAQKKCLEISNTGMAVIIDIGESNNIHPKNKQDVGKRLALWALAKDYGKNIVFSGPIYKSYKIEGDKLRILFDNVGSGLMIGEKKGLEPTREKKNGKLKWFSICGNDRKWHWANAEIEGDSIVVSCSKVKNPIAVRYAFTMNPEGCNLYNKEGLPASPFQTEALK